LPGSDESRFLPQHSDGIESEFGLNKMNLSCLASTVQAGGDGVMVNGIFFTFLGPLVPSEQTVACST